MQWFSLVLWFIFHIQDVCNYKPTRRSKLQTNSFRYTSDLLSTQYMKRHEIMDENSIESMIATKSHASSKIELKLHQYKGSYTVLIYVGKRKRVLVIDTGSSGTAFKCTICNNCDRDESRSYADFNEPSLLTCATNNKMKLNRCINCGNRERCVYKERYADGSSWYANKLIGNITFINHNNNGAQLVDMQLVFGCIISENGPFRKKNLDGIMGLSNSPDSFYNQVSVLESSIQPVFSQCISLSGGYMIFGGMETRFNLEHIKYTPLRYINNKNKYWSVYLDKISIDSLDLNFNATELNKGIGCVLDSGTTFTYLPPYMLNEFRLMWNKYVRDIPMLANNLKDESSDDDELDYKGGGYIFNLDQQIINNLPSINFHLRNGTKLAISARSYMRRLTNSNNRAGSENTREQFVSTIYFDKDIGNSIILGNSVLANHNVLYDAVNNVIGVSRADCDRSN